MIPTGEYSSLSPQEQDTAVPRSGRQPVTTLVIATLNRPEDLARCLRSVARVTPGFDEVILVEQGDLGRTERVVRPFRHLDIRVLPLGVRSLTRARNLALKRSRGDYVFFVDDDTELPPGYLPRLGGELVMVYLPTFRPGSLFLHRERLFGLFERLGLPVVDIRAAFIATGRPAESLRYLQGSHYSAAGYRIVADAVERELQASLAAAGPAPSPP